MLGQQCFRAITCHVCAFLLLGSLGILLSPSSADAQCVRQLFVPEGVIDVQAFKATTNSELKPPGGQDKTIAQLLDLAMGGWQACNPDDAHMPALGSGDNPQYTIEYVPDGAIPQSCFAGVPDGANLCGCTVTTGTFPPTGMIFIDQTSFEGGTCSNPLHTILYNPS